MSDSFQRLGRYEVRARIGEGGMASVFLGFSPSGEAVALKVIKDELSLNTDFVNMFMDEAKLVSRLSHPNIVRIHELGADGMRLFIAMELLFGQSFWHVWHACRKRGVRLRYDMAAWICARVAEGLHHAHEVTDAQGNLLHLVHRDVNASNVFVTFDGQVKVIDFGLAKAVGRISKTAAGVVKGKLAYMSPEQAVGEPIDRRSDVFALGITLWEVTTDRRLFKGADQMDTLKRVYAADVPNPLEIVDGYPLELWAIVRRALSKDKHGRFATALDLARELDRFAGSEGRTIGAEDVAEMMHALFSSEDERQHRWLADASQPARTGPMPPLSDPERPALGTLPPPPEIPVVPDGGARHFAMPKKTIPLLREPPRRDVVTMPLAGAGDRAEPRLDRTVPLAVRPVSQPPRYAPGFADPGSPGTSRPPVAARSQATPPSEPPHGVVAPPPSRNRGVLAGVVLVVVTVATVAIAALAIRWAWSLFPAMSEPQETFLVYEAPMR